MSATSLMETTKINLNEVRKAHALLHSPDQQVEIRVLLKDGGAMTGRFDDDAKMFEWLKNADDPGVAVVWWSIQQLVPEVSTNDLQRRNGSTNESVAIRNWLIVDIDPEREADPASDDEVYLASVKVNEVLDWLGTKGIMPRLAVMSGNGYHLYLPTHAWPNDIEHNSVAKAFLGMLSSKFSDGKVKVDTATANPGRLGKVPGCISRKGKLDGDRAHRMVEIEFVADALPLNAEAVKVLVEAEGHSIQPIRAPQKSAGLDAEFDIHDFAEWCGVTVDGNFEKNGCIYYALDACPMAEHTHRGQVGKSCFVVGDSLGFKCFSDDCEGFGIKDVLRKFREDNGPYGGPLFAQPDLSDRFQIDQIDTPHRGSTPSQSNIEDTSASQELEAKPIEPATESDADYASGIEVVRRSIDALMGPSDKKSKEPPIPLREKSRAACDLILRHLLGHGKLYNCGNVATYVDNRTREIIQVIKGGTKFQRLLMRYGIYPGEKLTDDIGQFLGAYASTAKENTIYNLSFYDRQRHVLYVNEYSGNFIRFDHHGVARLRNGDDDMLFTDGKESGCDPLYANLGDGGEYSYVWQGSLVAAKYGPEMDLIKTHILDTILYPEEGIGKENAQFILMTAILGLFFYERIPSYPFIYLGLTPESSPSDFPVDGLSCGETSPVR